MIRPALRAAAAALALACAVDPAVSIERTIPAPVDIRIGSAAEGGARARAIADTLADGLGSPAHAPDAMPQAVVLIDPAPADLQRLPDRVPVSVVTSTQVPAVEIVRVEQPGTVLPGQVVTVSVTLRVNRADANVRIALEQHGVRLAETIRAAPGEGALMEVDFAYTPPAAGVHALRILAGREGHAVPADAADVGVVAEARRLRVLVFEPRPTWSVTFLRRALEADPALDVGAVSRTSRGIDVRGGAAPVRLSASTLAPFDAVVAGAPEDLGQADLDALETFARERGGAVLFQPDRRPSGAFARRLPSAAFDEVLLPSPAALQGPGGPLRASELAVPRSVGGGITSLAGLETPAGARPAIFTWPVGHGRFVFNGALDAWRYRAGEDGFARALPGLVVALAAAAPRALELRVDPVVTGPGQPVAVRARIRASELVRDGGALRAPAVSAALVSPGGRRTFVRLWPTAEPGLFEGRVDAVDPGRHLVQVTAGAGTAAAPLLVLERAARPGGRDRAALEQLARGTGGVNASADDLSPVTRHLRALRTTAAATVHPMRSAWWLWGFAALLAAEWAMRRRKGLR